MAQRKKAARKRTKKAAMTYLLRIDISDEGIALYQSPTLEDMVENATELIRKAGRGQTVVVSMFSSDCKSCVREFRALAGAAEE